MAETYTCDRCQATDRRDAEWLIVEAVNEVSEFGFHGGPWHFCRWSCLVQFAQLQVQRQAARGA